MRKQAKIKIELKSDLISGSGEGWGNVIDNDITYDEFGFPYIPSRRIRGVMREACNEYEEFSGVKSVADNLFGTADHAGSLRIDNAYLDQLDAMHKEVLESKQDYKKYLGLSSVLNHYTNIRYQTAIDGESIAKKDSLRASRTIAKGNCFFASVEFDDSYDETIKDILLFAQHMGLNRTRGFGNVIMTLEDIKDYEVKNLSVVDELGDEDYEITIKVTNTAPLLIVGNSGENTLDYIPGSSVLGFFANLYAKDGDMKQFNDLFLKDHIRFCNGYISDYEWHEYEPSRKSLFKSKTNNIYYDYALDDKPDNDVAKAVKHMYATVNCYKEDDKEVRYLKKVNKEMFYHHTRPEDKSIGHAVSNEGEDNGLFYQNEVISSDQRFIIKIQGNGKYLKQALKVIPEYMQIGRSKNTQYGNLQVLDVKADKLIEDTINVKEKVAVTLCSPMVLLSDSLESNLNVENLADQLGLEDYTPYIEYTRVGGYNAKWQLQKPSYIAFAAGSTITGTLNKKANGSIGILQNEGNGQIHYEKVHPYTYMLENTYIKEDKEPSLLKPVMLDSLKNELKLNMLGYINDSGKEKLTASSVGKVIAMASSDIDSLEKDIAGIKDDSKREKILSIVNRVKKQCDQYFKASLIQKYEPEYLNQYYVESIREYFIHLKIEGRQK